MPACEMMTSLGPYLLGAVEFDEWSRTDQHLQQCGACQGEVVRLAGLPGLMGRIQVGEVLSEPGPLEKNEGPGRTKRVRGAPLARVGLTVVVLALAGWLGVMTMGRGLSPAWSHTFALVGANRVTHVSGGASLTAETWGTEIWVKLRGVQPGSECKLIVRARDGRTVVGGTWASGSADGAWIPATAPFRPSQIANVEIAIPSGHLVTLTTDIGAKGRRAPAAPPSRSLSPTDGEDGQTG